MNIYIVKRKEGSAGWDEWIGFVCYARTMNEAVAMHPSNGKLFPLMGDRREQHDWLEGWEHPLKLQATYIGQTRDVNEQSVLFTSYHHG